MKGDYADEKIFVNYLNKSRGVGTVTSTRIVVNTAFNTNALFESNNIERTIPSYRIKITGLRNGIICKYGSDSLHFFEITEDGIYMLPQITKSYIGFRFNKSFENENVIIQQLLS